MLEPTIIPSQERFIELATTRRVISVYAKLTCDDLTPVALYQLLCANRELTFLLESAEAGVWARYSIIGVNSQTTLTEHEGQAVWLGQTLAGTVSTDPIEALQNMLNALRTTPDPELPPFHAGLVGYLGYDIVRRLECLPDSNPDDLQVPELMMMLASDVAVLEHQEGTVWLIANAINFNNSAEGVLHAYAQARQRVLAMVTKIYQPRPVLTRAVGQAAQLVVDRQRSASEFEDMVRTAQEQIASGEAFQIVVSQRFSIETKVDPFLVYRALRVTNPSPYLYYLNLPGFVVLGSSPEALVTVKGELATTRPIAGTRPRGNTPDEDQTLVEELIADPKERAEHVMLVDLGRNDLGRVCVPGSVVVREFMNVHKYSHVMHMEAEVTGQVKPGHSALEVTLSCFPAGTLSGAPKIRAMEIIDQLETSRRGVYGGVVGYLDFAGNSDMAIAIRTAVLKDGIAHVQAGAGVVKDSIPEAEDRETRNKAAAVLKAIAIAEGMNINEVISTSYDG